MLVIATWEMFAIKMTPRIFFKTVESHLKMFILEDEVDKLAPNKQGKNNWFFWLWGPAD